MDNRINQNKVNNTNFNGIPKSGEVKTVETFMKEIVEDAITSAEREVAEYGNFTFSIKKFKNPNEKQVAKRFWIEIVQAPKGTENYQTQRGVIFYAQKNGFGTEDGPAVEALIETGTKKEILEKIKSEKFVQKLVKLVDDMSYNLIDLR